MRYVLGEPGITSCSRQLDSGGGHFCAHLFIDHCQVSFFFVCVCAKFSQIFMFGLDREIISTAKFSQSTVVRMHHKDCAIKLRK